VQRNGKNAVGIGVLVIVLSVGLNTAPLLSAIFVGLGDPSAYAYGVSGDGSVVTGLYSVPGPGSPHYAYRWTLATGMQGLGALGGTNPTFSEGYGVSANGSTIVGWSTSDEGGARAFREINNSGMQSLGVVSGWSASYGNAVSGDGSTVVGRGFIVGGFLTRAFRWTPGLGMEGLGALPGDNGEAVAYGVNGDGSIVVGESGTGTPRRAFRWTPAGMEELIKVSGATEASASGVSVDGSTIVGTNSLNGSLGVAVRWVNGNAAQSLGFLPGGFSSSATGVSADGSVIVGSGSTLSPGGHAFMWTTSNGLVDLNTYLPTFGINLSGWNLNTVAAVSGDGNTFIGRGIHNGLGEAWIATIPEPSSVMLLGLGMIVLAKRRRN
jgi:probable HAF family extracellular repeat protein